jgi:ELWxxDGT repeat protein
MQPFGDLIFFVAWTPETGHEIWRTDGTPAGTQLLRDIRTGPESSLPVHDDGVPELLPQFGTAGGLAAFVADDGEHGFEVWVSDGTEAGTRLLVDLNPGAGSAVVVGQTAPPLFRSVELGDRLVFTASDGTVGRELWISDGTAEGTSLVKDILPGAQDGIDVFPFDTRQPFVGSVDGELFFAAVDDVVFNSLWRTEGSPEGTRAVFPGQEQGRFAYIVSSTDAGILFRASTEQGGLGLFSIESAGSGGGGGGGCAMAGNRPSGDAEAIVLCLAALGLMLWRRASPPPGVGCPRSDIVFEVGCSTIVDTRAPLYLQRSGKGAPPHEHNSDGCSNCRAARLR